MKSREEQLSWAKQRALICVDMGRFADAVAMQRRAQEVGEPELVEEMKEHLQLYQSGKPCRKELPTVRAAREESKAVPWWKKKKRR